MNFDDYFIDKLKLELQKPLPGDEVRYNMSPPYRPPLTREEILKMHPRFSGVLLLLYKKENTLNIVFTQRKIYKGVHSGQMSFPGGKKDETDLDLVQTAIRETQEEVGVEKNKIEIIGSLSELYVPPSNFLVHPSVGFAGSIETFIPQKNEVEKIVEIPLEFFLDSSHINLQTEIPLVDNHVIEVPAYCYNEHIIWGATAIMLCEFMCIVENILGKKK